MHTLEEDDFHIEHNMKTPIRFSIMYRFQLKNKKKSMNAVTVHATEAYREGRDKINSCLTSVLDGDYVSTFTAMKGFYRGGKEKLKCHSCGNHMMRLTLDVAIQSLIKRNESNSFLRKCNFGNTTDNKLTLGIVTFLSDYLREDDFSIHLVI
jgi:hypothetical protein